MTIGEFRNSELKELYVDKKYSSQQIADWIFSTTGITITTRSVQRNLKSL